MNRLADSRSAMPALLGVLLSASAVPQGEQRPALRTDTRSMLLSPGEVERYQLDVESVHGVSPAAQCLLGGGGAMRFDGEGFPALGIDRLAVLPLLGLWPFTGGQPDPAIAYTLTINSGRNRGSEDLMMVNADGSNQTLVSAGSKTVQHRFPDWSPDGMDLVFASNIQGNGIYVIHRDGTGLRKVVDLTTSLMGAFESPAWSPLQLGGQYRIAYVDQPGIGLERDLFVVNLDGTGRTNLSNTAGVSEFFASWSPSGTRVITQTMTGSVRDRYGLMDFTTGQYTIQPYGGALQGHFVRRPSWSKTQENVIAVEAAPVDFPMDIWVIDLSNPGGAVNLTNTSGTNELGPSWSPDDSRIVFGRDTLEVMNADGTNRHEILPKPRGSRRYPSWRRNP